MKFAALLILLVSICSCANGNYYGNPHAGAQAAMDGANAAANAAANQTMHHTPPPPMTGF